MNIPPLKGDAAQTPFGHLQRLTRADYAWTELSVSTLGVLSSGKGAATHTGLPGPPGRSRRALLQSAHTVPGTGFSRRGAWSLGSHGGDTGRG